MNILQCLNNDNESILNIGTQLYLLCFLNIGKHTKFRMIS